MRGLRIRNVLLAVLLAAACIAAAELIACRIMDPALYETVTAPVRSRYHAALDAVQEEYLSFRRAIEARAEARAEAKRLALEAAQRADEPAVPGVYVPVDPAITQLAELDGKETLLGGNVALPYYDQGDEAWAERLYGSDPIGVYGCGPTALAMAVSGLTDADLDPAEMAEWAAENGYCAPRSGSYHSIVRGAAERFGLTCVSLAGADAQELADQLAISGGVAVALMGPGHFTKSGHFILIHGVTLGGELLVADPNSRERSLTTWDGELLVSELHPSTDAGAPLWLLTPPGLGIPQPEEGSAP